MGDVSETSRTLRAASRGRIMARAWPQEIDSSGGVAEI